MARKKFMQPDSVDDLLAKLGDPSDPVLNDAEFRKLVSKAQKKIKDRKLLKAFLGTAMTLAKVGVKVLLV